MGASEQVAITIEVPLHFAGELKELLAEYPQLHYFKRGWVVQKFAIIGSPPQIEAFRPVLDAWWADCQSRDAW